MVRKWRKIWDRVKVGNGVKVKEDISQDQVAKVSAEAKADLAEGKGATFLLLAQTKVVTFLGLQARFLPLLLSNK